ncbi:hypothetical protein CUMW_054700 [Citrus unshiu]|nr:hypothetical protein CUMW_054700 [Citrus unshiu]
MVVVIQALLLWVLAVHLQNGDLMAYAIYLCRVQTISCLSSLSEPISHDFIVSLVLAWQVLKMEIPQTGAFDSALNLNVG